MAIKRIDREEEEFQEIQEIIEALRESYEELLEDADSESGFFAFWADQNGETIHIRCSDGDCGSISSAEFWEIRNQVDQECLVCAGTLKIIFDSESKPVLCLVCDRCEAAHRVASGELCLFAN